MRYTGPKNKIARREGIDLALKAPGTKSHARLLRKLNIVPGQHGLKGRRRFSERGEQLREKQKLRFIFGISEKQLKKYFVLASKMKGDTTFHLLTLLEKRLDNIVFRLGFAPTRASARQLVSHGHILVNKRKVTIPSYQVKVGDEINFSNEKIIKADYIEKTLNNKEINIPKWLEKKGIFGKIMAEPNSFDVAKLLNLRLVIDYYSR